MGIGASFECRITGLDIWKQQATSSLLRATNNAGTSALRAMKAEGSRQIREVKGIQATKIDVALTTARADTYQAFVWKLIARSKPLPLMVFGARQRRSGVSVEVTKGNRKIIPHTFIATMASGHQGVFVRSGPKRHMASGRYKGQRRQPIKELFSASVSGALRTAAPIVLERGASVFRATMSRLTGSK